MSQLFKASLINYVAPELGLRDPIPHLCYSPFTLSP